MEHKIIKIDEDGCATLFADGSISIERYKMSVPLGFKGREFAEAILELLGDEPKPRGDDCYIMVVGSGSFVGKTIHDAIPWESKDPTTGFLDNYHHTVREEFHIFRRIATVGPIPQPAERKVTRYE